MAVCVFYAGNTRYDDFKKICKVITELAETGNIDMFLVGEGDGFDAAVRRAFRECENNYTDISFFVLTSSPCGCADNLSSIYVQPANKKELSHTEEWLKKWLLLQADIFVTVENFWDGDFDAEKVIIIKV